MMDVLHTVRDEYGRKIRIYENINRALEGKSSRPAAADTLVIP